MQIEALQYVHEAASLPVQGRVFVELELPRIGEEIAARAAARSRTARRPSSPSQPERIRLFAPIRSAVDTLVVKVLEGASKQATLVRAALALWDHTDPDETIWQMALVGLRQQLKNLAMLRSGIRRIAKAADPHRDSLVRLLWSPALEERYVDLAEDLDDLAETIALGLNDEMRAQIDAGLVPARPE